MKNIKTTRVSNFLEYMTLVEEESSIADSVLWYRGCGDVRHRLLPSLYRHKESKSIEELMKLESELTDRFRQRSIPFRTRDITNDWEWLFFMQHFGVPTRFLDWTESPLVALFFAVVSSPHSTKKNGKIDFKNDAVVWMLRPTKWNVGAIELNSFTGKVIGTDDPNASSYKPPGDCSSMKEYPIAIYGAHNSQRIVAQRGVFVCFGKKTSSMEEMFSNGNFDDNCLRQVIIPKESLPLFLHAIRRHGVSDSVVFPDLDGLAREIRREYRFEV